MISILVVAGEGMELDWLAGRYPSVEVLTARGLDETLEKLGRNRRFDAVLLLAGGEVTAIVEAIREDNPAHPPLFLPAGPQAAPGTRPLNAREPAELLDLLLREMES